MEHWLRVNIQGDGRGHFLGKCEARDQPGTGNTLRFELTFDQTELPPILIALDESFEPSRSKATRDRENIEAPRRLPRGFSLLPKRSISRTSRYATVRLEQRKIVAGPGHIG
jgi:hypothetical protein